MIRVAMGSLYHFGIYVSDAEVIQFGLAPNGRTTLRDSEVEVLSAPFCKFLENGEAEVCEFTPQERENHRSSEETVAYARSKLGMRGYHIIYNNCEHFANECISGVAVCRQAEEVRAMFRNMPVVDVYLQKLPEEAPEAPLDCALRQAQIDSISDDVLKRQKYYVWKLLGYGLERSLGKRMKEMVFSRDENGVYSTEGVYFSLSHSGNALAAAVSRAPVGVDVESLNAPFLSGMARRSMTGAEYAVYEQLPEGEKRSFFVKLWTAKEALFKVSGTASFLPAQQDTQRGSYGSFEKNLGSERYILSVATKTPEKIRIFEV